MMELAMTERLAFHGKASLADSTKKWPVKGGRWLGKFLNFYMLRRTAYLRTSDLSIHANYSLKHSSCSLLNFNISSHFSQPYFITPYNKPEPYFARPPGECHFKVRKDAKWPFSTQSGNTNNPLCKEQQYFNGIPRINIE